MSGGNWELEVIDISRENKGNAETGRREKAFFSLQGKRNTKVQNRQIKRQQKRRLQKKHLRKSIFKVLCLCGFLAIGCWGLNLIYEENIIGDWSLKNIFGNHITEQGGMEAETASFPSNSWKKEGIQVNQGEQEWKHVEGNYPEGLLELAEKNEEALDFVENYPNREKYMNQVIDLSEDYTQGEVPLLMQWDKRWGYNSYGSGIIGLEGCGPACLSMAYIYLTGDTEMNPGKMAEFAEENGFYTTEGTSWSLWTEGVQQLGLSGEVLSLSENTMKLVLDAGGVIVCSMRPGEFTTTGHYILIRGYDENGFFVNDPNRRSNSEKQWDYDTLSKQIKNLWGISF